MKKNDWNKWVDKNRPYLINECGLPLSVLESWQNWFYFLDHGDYTTPGSKEVDVYIWSLKKENAFNLYHFLKWDEHFKSSRIVNDLEYRINEN